MLSPGGRKLALTAHVVSSVGWLGAVAAFLALAVVGLAGADGMRVRGAYVAMDLVTWSVIVPACVASLATGVVVALGTQWGLFRHWWVVIKAGLTLVATLLLFVHTHPIHVAARAAAEAAAALDDLRPLRTQLVVDASAALLLLLVTTVLSIYKPRGMTSSIEARRTAGEPMSEHEQLPETAEIEPALTPDAVAALVANHRRFLAFVQRRIGDRALAEEILQDAFVRSLDTIDQVRDTAIGWFYRVLRNAIIDHQRRVAAAARRLDAYAHEQDEATDDELREVVCACVGELARTLKPEYAAALRRIEIDGVAVKDYATEAGISSSNAGVRIFRAREALRKQVARACGTCADHGCLDCTCGSKR